MGRVSLLQRQQPQDQHVRIHSQDERKGRSTGSMVVLKERGKKRGKEGRGGGKPNSHSHPSLPSYVPPLVAKSITTAEVGLLGSWAVEPAGGSQFLARKSSRL